MDIKDTNIRDLWYQSYEWPSKNFSQYGTFHTSVMILSWNQDNTIISKHR